MPKKVLFSGQNLSLSEAVLHHSDVAGGLNLFFSPVAPSYAVRFTGYRPDEVRAELDDRLAELDHTTTMNLLAAVEASFRVDYLHRCYQNKKDPISRQFSELHREKGSRASLEDDIFEVWKTHTTGGGPIISELRGAFRFRHWLAHGRYWRPKLGRKYDYLSVYPLTLKALASFPLMAP